MEKSVRNRILLAAGIVLVVVSIIFVKVILLGTAGPVNPAFLPGFYLPAGEGEQENILGQLGKEQYVPIEKPGGQSSTGFPDLSQYSASGSYERRNSTDTYRVVSWYFDDWNDFTIAEKRLLALLGTSGEIQPASLNMTLQYQDFQEVNRVNEIVDCPDIPPTLQATAFESTNESGYFFAVQTPLNRGREDYFIVGYLAENGNLTGQGPYLKDLIARGYYNVTGSYSGLARESNY